MYNTIPVFNKEYDNEDNKKIIKDLFLKEGKHIQEIKSFDVILKNKLSNINVGSSYVLSYYVELYISFLYFNYYYENSLNWSPVPVYYPTLNLNTLSLNITVNFHALNYNIGHFFSIEDWKNHYNCVKSTLNFINENKMKVVKQVENLKNDIEVLNKFINEFFVIKNKEKSTMNDFKEFEDKLTKIEIKNEIYKNNIIYSIKGNVEYLSKYISAMRKEYKNIEEKKISELNELKKNFNKLQEENKKTKDFYLTVSGAVMALISLVSGNISMVSNQIFISHILIFNCSILTAILIFSSLFNSIYNQENEGYPKRAVKIIIGLLVFIIFCVLLYK